MLENQIQIKFAMQHMPKNGHFFQRRRMFVQAPFHNMKSYVPLDWSSQQTPNQQLQRIKYKQTQQHQSLRKIYNSQVDRRLRDRYGAYSTIDPNLSMSRNEDILSKQVQNFNSSKLNSGESSRIKPEKRQFGFQYQPLQNTDSKHPIIQVSNKSKQNQNEQRENLFQISNRNDYKEQLLNRNLNPQISTTKNYGEPSIKSYDPNYPYLPQQNNSPLIRDRYRSLQLSRNSPTKQQLSKLVQELYTGTKVEQYPFRNVMPDKLQNHLRQKTKADRKRAYQVTLNLFQH